MCEFAFSLIRNVFKMPNFYFKCVFLSSNSVFAVQNSDTYLIRITRHICIKYVQIKLLFLCFRSTSRAPESVFGKHHLPEHGRHLLRPTRCPHPQWSILVSVHFVLFGVNFIAQNSTPFLANGVWQILIENFRHRVFGEIEWRIFCQTWQKRLVKSTSGVLLGRPICFDLRS